MHWSFGKESLPGLPTLGLISLIPWSAVSRLIMLKLNFDQSQTYLRSAMWNLLGAAVCAEADCDIGSGTALCLAAAAGDRAGSLDSNSIIISPFKSSAFLHDYAQQWNLKSSTAGDSLRARSHSPLLSFSVCLFLTLCHLCEACVSPPLAPLPFPIYTGFWPRAGHFTQADFSQAPWRLFYQDSH